MRKSASRLRAPQIELFHPPPQIPAWSKLPREITAVSRRAELHGSVPDCSDTRPVHSLQMLHESRQDAHTTDATDNGSLAFQYYGY